MNDIMDLIYEVFEEIKRAEKEKDFKTVIEKNEELDRLRVELSTVSNNRGSRIQILERNKR